MSDQGGGPGPMTRRRSSSASARASAAPYVKRSSSSSERASASSSTGLTAYTANIGLGFDEDDDDQEASEGSSRARTGLAGKAISAAMSFRPGARPGGKAKKAATPDGPPRPVEVVVWKPNADDKLGLTFEVPEDSAQYKGVVVAAVHEGFLMAKTKKLKVGDVVHLINGRPVTTPQEGAAYLRDAKGVIQLVVTHADAKPKRGGAHGGAAASDGGASSSAADDNAPKEDADGNQTVVVSCSQLIIESKRIVGTAGGLDQTLDELFAKLKAKEVGSKEALTKLMELVGQTTVEQAGLVIANAAKGSLPDGWVEYMDSQSNKKYYYNVHTKATTWTKPVKPRDPPPPPEPARRRSKGASPSGRSSTQPSAIEEEDEEDEEMMVSNDDDAEDSGDGDEATSHRELSGRVRHNLADAIANRSTKKKMIDTVQLECSIRQRHGIRGLQSVSL